jgi:thiol-disulfide isomerase/thioredoxin
MKLLALIVLFFCFPLSTHANASLVPEGIITLDGSPAPALQLSDIDGEPFDLRELSGKWVFVHFWASWCGPCRREMPTVQHMAEIMKDTPLKIVLVNTAETEDTVFTFMGITAPDLNTLLDRDGLVTERWQPRGLPSTFLVNPAGQLRYLALGGRKWDKLEYINFLQHIVHNKNMTTD